MPMNATAGLLAARAAVGTDPGGTRVKLPQHVTLRRSEARPDFPPILRLEHGVAADHARRDIVAGLIREFR
jgi:hypothetical protein